MQDDASLKNDANPYAAPSLDDASARALPAHEMKTRRPDRMVFSAYFCTATAGGILGFPFAQALGIVIEFVWVIFVGTVPFLALAFRHRSDRPNGRFRVRLGLSGALTGFACVCCHSWARPGTRKILRKKHLPACYSSVERHSFGRYRGRIGQLLGRNL